MEFQENEQEFPTKSGRVYVTVARELADGVRQAGGVPIVIPMGTPDLAKDYIDVIDKLILSGGQHVDPSLYGQKRLIDSDDYLLERDEFELALIAEAYALAEKTDFAVLPWDAATECCTGRLEQEVANHWQTDLVAPPIVCKSNHKVVSVSYLLKEVNQFLSSSAD